MLTRVVQTPVLPDRQSLVNNKTFADWALNLWQTNKTGEYTWQTEFYSWLTYVGPYSIIGGGGALAQLGLPVIAPEVFSSIASDIENQDPATLLPANTDSTIVAGYRAQLQLMAKAARSNNTAWLQMGLGGNPFGSTDQWIFNIHPLSRGTVNIDTSNPNAEPLVDYRMLSNPVDLRVAIALFRGVRDYFTSQGEMKRLSAVETKPGANVTSDEDIGKYLSTTLNPSQYHPVGTAAMLPLRLGGVVDDELKVHGVERLSIIDASIMPLIVGATTQSTVYAIAEKVSISSRTREDCSTLSRPPT
jgi:choline dehydrogenase